MKAEFLYSVPKEYVMSFFFLMLNLTCNFTLSDQADLLTLAINHLS